MGNRIAYVHFDGLNFESSAELRQNVDDINIPGITHSVWAELHKIVTFSKNGEPVGLHINTQDGVLYIDDLGEDGVVTERRDVSLANVLPTEAFQRALDIERTTTKPLNLGHTEYQAEIMKISKQVQEILDLEDEHVADNFSRLVCHYMCDKFRDMPVSDVPMTGIQTDEQQAVPT